LIVHLECSNELKAKTVSQDAISSTKLQQFISKKYAEQIESRQCRLSTNSDQ